MQKYYYCNNCKQWMSKDITAQIENEGLKECPFCHKVNSFSGYTKEQIEEFRRQKAQIEQAKKEKVNETETKKRNSPNSSAQKTASQHESVKKESASNRTIPKQVSADDLMNYAKSENSDFKFQNSSTSKDKDKVEKKNEPEKENLLSVKPSIFNFSHFSREELKCVAKKLGVRIMKSDTTSSLIDKINEFEDDEVYDVLLHLGFLEDDSKYILKPLDKEIQSDSYAKDKVIEAMREKLLTLDRPQVKAIAKSLGENIYKKDTVETLVKRICSYPIDDIRAASNTALAKPKEIFLPTESSNAAISTDIPTVSQAIQPSNESIRWNDETLEHDYTDAETKSADGSYNPNYDGFYEDTQPEDSDDIAFESKKKIFLKIGCAVVGIIGVIVYLTLTTVI